MASNGGSSAPGVAASQSQGNTSLPKDALVMSSILKEMGVTDYEPQVVHQMLEFTYTHVSNVLEEARALSDHAGKSSIDARDARLAISVVADHSFQGPPPRDFMLELAKEKNEKPLPPIVEKNGQRLPAERYCLLANNFQVKHVKAGKGSSSSSTSSSRGNHLSMSHTPSTPTQQLSTASLPVMQAHITSPGSGMAQLLTLKTPVLLSPAADGSLVARPMSSSSSLASMSRSPSDVSIATAGMPTAAATATAQASPIAPLSAPASASTGGSIGEDLAVEVGMMDGDDDGELEEEMITADQAPGDVSLDTEALGIGVKRRRSDEDEMT